MNVQPRISQPVFKGYGNESFRMMSYDEFMSDYNPTGNDFETEDSVMSKEAAENLRKRHEAFSRMYQEMQKENERIFREHILPDSKNITGKILDLPTYSSDVLPFLIDTKKSDLEYLHQIASKTDSIGEMRIPGCTIPFFTQISSERLKMLEPIMLSKNDAGMWNYAPTFIIDLDRNYSDKQIYIMSKLADCKVNGMNLRQIAEHPSLNHKKTIEKAEELNTLYGDKLREIEFFSNRLGENWLSADIQLPHRDDKPDWQNFQRVFAPLDDDVNPILTKNSVREIDTYIDDMYSKLEDRLCVFKEADLDRAITDVQMKNPDATEEEILRTMQKLTQFSNYSSIEKVGQELQTEHISKLFDIKGINPCFDYFNRKGLFSLYGTKNEDTVGEIEGFCGIFITKDDLKDEDFQTILTRAKKKNIKFINLEGWSDGVNLLTDDKKLAEYTDKVLKRAKKIQARRENYTYNDALEYVLNQDINNALKAHNLNLVTVQAERPASRDMILEQMRPNMPTKSMLKSTIESVSKFYTKDTPKEFPSMCMKIAKYYDENLNVFSKQSIIENLKLLNNNIDSFLQENSLNRDFLYILAPKLDETKSFDLIDKMYANLYNIPEQRIIKTDAVGKLKVFPKDSTFLVLDDIIASGSSSGDVGDYVFYNRHLPKDKHILFCPITAVQDGINYLNESIKMGDREGIDKILNIKENTKDYSTVTSHFRNVGVERLNDAVFGWSGHGQYGMCTVFPYMSPDNNSDLSSHIVKFFVPKNDCIKNQDKHLSEIEENTLYYDIFGTDKEHIITDPKRVYTPKNNFIKNTLKRLLRK